jgi:aspartyl-tRNA(Asn)/glutamyl-tRNA(Gln) amidotransferase subunit B
MVREGEVSSRGAKEILSDALSGGKSVRVIAEEKELFQKSDKGELEKIVKKIISENEGVVLEYKGGKEKSLQFLIGQAMRQTKGSANPQVLTDIFKKLIT